MQISCCKAWHINITIVRYISMNEIDGTGNVVESVCYNEQEKIKSSSSSSPADIKISVLPD